MNCEKHNVRNERYCKACTLERAEGGFGLAAGDVQVLLDYVHELEGTIVKLRRVVND